MIVYGSDIVSWIRYQSCLCTFAFPHLFQPSLDKSQTGLDIYCPRNTLLFFCSCRFSLAALLHLASLIVFCCAHQLCSWYLACSCTISLPCFCWISAEGRVLQGNIRQRYAGIAFQHWSSHAYRKADYTRLFFSSLIFFGSVAHFVVAHGCNLIGGCTRCYWVLSGTAVSYCWRPFHRTKCWIICDLCLRGYFWGCLGGGCCWRVHTGGCCLVSWMVGVFQCSPAIKIRYIARSF